MLYSSFIPNGHHTGLLFLDRASPNTGLLPERRAMTTKRVPPLNNPPSERAVAVAPVKTLKRDDDDKGMGGGRAREGGGRGRGRGGEALLKFQLSGRLGQGVFALGKAS